MSKLVLLEANSRDRFKRLLPYLLGFHFLATLCVIIY